MANQVFPTKGNLMAAKRSLVLAKLGYEVLRLVRIKFCNYELGDLKQGEIKQLNSPRP